MYYYSKKSRKKILHTDKCFHISQTDIRDIGWFETLPEAHARGYRLCRHCSQLHGQYKRERRRIFDICMKQGLIVLAKRNCLSITSIGSKWLLTLNANHKLVLYHKNEYVTHRDRFSAVDGYHLQRDARGQSIEEYLQYIIAHDAFRRQQPLFSSPCAASLTQKKPPRKGTKRYKKEQKQQKKRERKQAIRRVLTLIDTL